MNYVKDPLAFIPLFVIGEEFLLRHWLPLAYWIKDWKVHQAAREYCMDYNSKLHMHFYTFQPKEFPNDFK